MKRYTVNRKVLGLSLGDTIISDDPFYAGLAANGHLTLVDQTPDPEPGDVEATDADPEPAGEERDAESGKPAGRGRGRNREGAGEVSGEGAEPSA